MDMPPVFGGNKEGKKWTQILDCFGAKLLAMTNRGIVIAMTEGEVHPRRSYNIPIAVIARL
jgi:hypothetical protein